MSNFSFKFSSNAADRPDYWLFTLLPLDSIQHYESVKFGFKLKCYYFMQKDT